MSSINKKNKISSNDRLAGGFGNYSASQSNEAHLRRCVMTCLLWENNAYIDGVSIAEDIAKLIPTIKPQVVADIAIEARFTQKLRHIPLFLCREMAKLDSHKYLVAETLSKVIHRPDELTEFLSIYWKDGKVPLSAQVKKGLASAFTKFNEYQLAKYNRKKEVCLKDVLRLCHAKAKDSVQNELWQRLLGDSLKTPDTWEVGLSAAKGEEEKRAVWERLISEKKLGAFAFLKNLRNMISVNVTPSLIREGLATSKKEMILPIDFLKAQKYAPDYTRELENAMLECTSQWKKLPGKTILVVDVSGSMGTRLSNKSEFTRMDAAAAMAVLTAEICESVSIYTTAGSDYKREHKTLKIKPYRGFALSEEILKDRLGGGGIFTRQCLEYINEQEREIPDRIIIFSDSQDCDLTKKLPKPFGKKNYIVDISSHKNGVNYKGVWTAEISGWSEGFLNFIANQ